MYFVFHLKDLLEINFKTFYRGHFKQFMKKHVEVLKGYLLCPSFVLLIELQISRLKVSLDKMCTCHLSSGELPLHTNLNVCFEF